MGTAVETQNEIEQLMNSTRDSVGLLLDTGHLLFADGDYDKIISNYGDRINHIHTKDIRKDVFKNVDKSKDSFLDCVYWMACLQCQEMVALIIENLSNGLKILDTKVG